MLAKRFFYVCAGFLCLALSYHLGARNAGAQAPGNPIVGVANDFVVLENGDLYIRDPNWSGSPAHWIMGGNVFSGPTPAQRETFGALKSRYRGERTTQSTPQGR